MLWRFEDHPVESSLDLRAERIRISPDYLKVMLGVELHLTTGRELFEVDFACLITETPL
jgi:hypothetical protein